VTILEMRAAGPVDSAGDRRPGEPATNDLIARLRESAGRKVPFSPDKILLRAAASAIERLDIEVHARVADVRRLTAELNALRGTSGSS
jgi:hypothetical protein